jgi:acetolactate synthase-1/2/3 large subunit
MVADVLIGGLGRLGAARGFTVAGGPPQALVEAAARAAFPVTAAADVTTACVMAAVTGDLTGAPAAVLLEHVDRAAALVEGAREAGLARSPMVVITGQVGPTGRVPPPELTAVCKASIEVTPASAAHWIAHAGHLALTAPRGPVHLALRGDTVRQPAVPVATRMPRATAARPPEPSDLDEAARRLAAAARPVIVAGVEARSAEVATWLRALAEALPAPVVTTERAMGAVPGPHPLCFGVLGVSRAADAVIARADLVVALGVDPVEVPPAWAPAAPILRLAASPATAPAPSSPFRDAPAAEVVGEVGAILEELAPRLRDRARADWDVAELDRLRRTAGAPSAPGARPTPERVVVMLREAMAAGTMLAVEPGRLTAAALAGWDAVAPGEVVAAAGGPLAGGYAVAAAMAARLARPGARVLCLTDGAGLAASAGTLAALAADHDVLVVVADVAVTAVAASARRAGFTVFTADTEAVVVAALARAVGSSGPSLVAITVAG